MEVKRRKVPWTQKHRPRFLDELVLKRTQQTYLLSWWRCWKVWWILRRTWAQEEREKWFSWAKTDKEKEKAKKILKKWKKFFKKEFASWMGDVRTKCKTSGSYCYPPESQQALFEPVSKTQYTTDLKPDALAEIKEWLQKTWTEFLKENEVEERMAIPPLPPYDPLLLVGPPGNGKTATAYALSGEVGVSLTELNASDDRSKKSVKRKLGRIVRSGTLTASKNPRKPPRIILFDEVDGMAGRKDRGGFGELLSQLEKTRLPVIMTANDKDDRKVGRLMRNYYNTTIFFNRPKPYQIDHLIDKIAKKEDMEIPKEIREKLKRAQDLRTVVKALEDFHSSREIPKLEKDKMRGFKTALKKNFSFKQDGTEDTMRYIQKRIRSVEGKDLGDFIMWSWENATKFVNEENLYPFYRELAYANYIYRLGRRRRAWRVSYSSSEDLAYAMTKYGEEERNIWALRKRKLNFPLSFKSYSREKKFKKSSTGEGKLWPLVNELARRQHISTKRARRELKLLSFIGKEAPERAGGILAGLDVDLDVVKIFAVEYELNAKQVKKGYETGREILGTQRMKESSKGRRKELEKEGERKKRKEEHEEEKKGSEKEGQKAKEEEGKEKKTKGLEDFL